MVSERKSLLLILLIVIYFVLNYCQKSNYLYTTSLLLSAVLVLKSDQLVIEGFNQGCIGDWKLEESGEDFLIRKKNGSSYDEVARFTNSNRGLIIKDKLQLGIFPTDNKYILIKHKDSVPSDQGFMHGKDGNIKIWAQDGDRLQFDGIQSTLILGGAKKY